MADFSSKLSAEVKKKSHGWIQFLQKLGDKEREDVLKYTRDQRYEDLLKYYFAGPATEES